MIYVVFLPKDVLEKLYFKNAERLLVGLKPAADAPVRDNISMTSRTREGHSSNVPPAVKMRMRRYMMVATRKNIPIATA